MTNTNTQGETVAKAVDGGKPLEYWAIHSISGAHIGLWQDEKIARRVFEEEYPDGTISHLAAAPPSPAPSQYTGWSDEAVEAAARAMEPMAFREEYTATDEFFDLEQEGRAQAIGRARAALTAASSISPATGFEVKALEWNGDFAHTGLGLFYDIDHATGVPGLVVLEKIEGSCTTKSAWPDFPSAEAHAQADFDRRIRSSISPTVTAKDGEAWQDIATAPKDGSSVLLWLGAPWSKVEKARFYTPWNNWQVGAIPVDPARETEMYGIGAALPTHWQPLPTPPAKDTQP